ncbi:MAG: DUF423 domain-containing protein [Proteobacteria bacterium]|nr:DUF423 domain-containing protein [Pseudomonadota bacterium]
MTQRHPFIILGAAGAFFSVAFGAFGAHSMKTLMSPELQVTFETAVRYQMYHSLALLVLGVLVMRARHRNLIVAGWLFAWGIVLFSGSLYLLSMTSATWLGIVTPMGGTLFLAGWVFLAVGDLKGRLASP